MNFIFSFCTFCKKNFQVLAKEYIHGAATIRALPKKEKESEMAPDSKEIKKQEEKPRLLDDEFIKKQFEVQREITTRLLSKIKMQEELTLETTKIMREQQEAFKKLSSVLM